MIEAALELAARGVAVFPLNADKSPRTPRGFHDATTNRDIIAGWDWHDGMIGSPPKCGTIIIDVDPRNGGEMTLSLFPALPCTRTTKTRSGGYHYWLTVDPDLKLRGTLGPGIDVKRAGKGYVVIPPSPGYEYVVFGAMAVAPEWLVEELKIDERSYDEEPSSPKFFPFQQGTAYGVAALGNTLDRLAEADNGSRNEELNKSAFALAQLAAGGELSQKVAVDALRTTALDIGLSDWEARRTIESGWTAGLKVPRQAPERAA